MEMTASLSFKGQCEEALRLYERCLGGQLEQIFRYGSPMADQGEAEAERIYRELSTDGRIRRRGQNRGPTL
jgi:uncharacterized glyoxalase superfamily protein PhnB